MVNALEDFVHGSDGHYSYGKYQTRKQPNGNMDVVFALHALKFELILEEDSETGVARRSELGRDLSSNERIKWKTRFRSEAMRTFEDDCPHQLLTEMGIKDQQEMRQQARRREDDEERQRHKETRLKEPGLLSTNMLLLFVLAVCSFLWFHPSAMNQVRTMFG